MGIMEFIPSTPLDADHGGVSYRGMTLASLAEAGLPDAVQLASVQAFLKAQIDTQAEGLRSKVLTSGSGQALEYQEVQTQAFAALAAGANATAGQFPMLASTIGIDIDPQTKVPATDVLGVARSVIAAYSAWTTIGAAIRAARLKGKAAIEAATSISASAAAFDAIAWPTLA